MLPAGSKLCSKISLHSVPRSVLDLQWRISGLNLLVFSKLRVRTLTENKQGEVKAKLLIGLSFLLLF